MNLFSSLFFSSAFPLPIVPFFPPLLLITLLHIPFRFSVLWNAADKQKKKMADIPFSHLETAG